jgi:hypothetical protein
MPWQNGTWFGRLSPAHKAAGGAWLVGDQPTDSSPDYPGKNNGQLQIKLWFATPEKYESGKYSFKHRKGSNFWEYVRVGEGRLDCLTKLTAASPACRHCLTASSEGVDIPPHFLRTWELPPRCSGAHGITVCRSLIRDAPIQSGQGDNYDFLLKDTVTCEESALLFSRFFQQYRYGLVIPLRGVLNLVQSCDHTTLEVGDYLFINFSQADISTIKSNGCLACIFFN